MMKTLVIAIAQSGTTKDMCLDRFIKRAHTEL